MMRGRLRSIAVMRVGPLVLIALFVPGCGRPPQTDQAPPAVTYPAGWERKQYSDAFWVPSGFLQGDRALMEWYEKGLAKLPRPTGANGWSCEAWSGNQGRSQFSVVWARLHGTTGLPASVVEDTFAMIARRSPDMTEVEAPGAAGAGYGVGKAYRGENARLFIRVGAMGSVLYVVIVRGDGALGTDDPYLRAFFDGFEPIAR